MRSVIYKRVSDDEQVKEGYSLESQHATCMRWIADKGYDLVDEYADEGKSAKNMKRPQLQRLMRDIELRKFDLLVFWRLNRLTRNLKDKIHLFELCEKYNVSLKSMTEEIDTTTASGRMVTNLLVSVAQGEREQTGENVHGTMAELAMKGIRNGAVAPFGYNLVDKQLIVNPIEAEIVKRIFKLYQKNKSTRYIAKLFNQPPAVPKRGSNWADHSVYYIITNPVYCGRIRWNYRKASGKRTGKEIIVVGSHEPIISEEEFECVQEMRIFRKRIGKRATSDFPFTGVLRCGRCGHALIGGSRKTKYNRKRYYKCLGRFNYGTCDMPIVAEDTLVDTFLHVLSLPQRELEKRFMVKETNAQDTRLMDRMLTELAEIKKRKKKWQLAYAGEAITLDELREHTAEDRTREEYIKGQLEAVPVKKISRWTKEQIIQQLKQFSETWRKVEDDTAKKNFINSVFEHITVNTDVTRGIGGPGRRIPLRIDHWEFIN